MGKETILFSSEEPRSLQSVAEFLHQLAEKLNQNEVIFKQGEQELVVRVPDNVVLEIKVEEEAKKAKTQQSIEIEIEWYQGDEAGGSVSLG